MEHPPDSPNLAPYDFYLLLKVKLALKKRVEIVEAVKEKLARVANELTKEDFRYRFKQWKVRMERCSDGVGEYVEGGNN